MVRPSTKNRRKKEKENKILRENIKEINIKGQRYQKALEENNLPKYGFEKPKTKIDPDEKFENKKEFLEKIKEASNIEEELLKVKWNENNLKNFLLIIETTSSNPSLGQFQNVLFKLLIEKKYDSKLIKNFFYQEKKKKFFFEKYCENLYKKTFYCEENFFEEELIKQNFVIVSEFILFSNFKILVIKLNSVIPSKELLIDIFNKREKNLFFNIDKNSLFKNLIIYTSISTLGDKSLTKKQLEKTLVELKKIEYFNSNKISEDLILLDILRIMNEMKVENKIDEFYFNQEFILEFFKSIKSVKEVIFKSYYLNEKEKILNILLK
jgi:hypothetical protein